MGILNTHLLAGLPAAMVMAVSVAFAADAPGSAEAVTTAEPAIEVEDLKLLLVPLDKAELLVEAEGWRQLVKTKAGEISRAEIAVRHENAEVSKAEEIRGKTADVRARLDKLPGLVAKARESGAPADLDEARKGAASAAESVHAVHEAVTGAVEAVETSAHLQRNLGEEARQRLRAMVAAIREAKGAIGEVEKALKGGAEGGSLDSDAADAAGSAAERAGAATERLDEDLEAVARAVKAATERGAALDDAIAAIGETEEARETDKITLLETVTRLREQRTQLLDNFRAVVEELGRKTDKADTDTQAKIADYRLYIRGVSGIHLDVTDTTSAWVSLKGWTVSQEGGRRWLVNLLAFAGIVLGAWFLSRLLSRTMAKAAERLEMPALLGDFLTRSIRWVVMIIGGIWALSALEVSIAPVVALFGAAGFIIAFAMQDSLSNFASGLMILFFRPFDMGDVVDAGGVSGKVNSVNLVSTTIRTFDNKMMVVPNSKIWSDVITNATGVTERRVDMEFGIGYGDDIDRVQKILEEVVKGHPLVLKNPEPVVRLSQLADSSVNFICRPWARPADYWDVHWDVTREVKKRFDAEGIGIPFPQRDVHLYIEKGEVTKGAGKEGTAPGHRASEGSAPATDGGLDV